MKRSTTRFYRIDLRNHAASYELEELIKEFLRHDEYRLINSAVKRRNSKPVSAGKWQMSYADVRLPSSGMEKNDAKRFLYDSLADLTDCRPAWGTLTGVRPTKLANELMSKNGLSYGEVYDIFRNKYYVNHEKTQLVLDTCKNQAFITSEPAGRTAGVYIGIPFCPTRCLYCSFTSNQADESAMERYLEALLKETESVGTKMKQLDIKAESIYVGGGTPTSLSPKQLERLMSHINRYFDISAVREFCTEAGRPDTITAEKLAVLKRYGVDRISINPQSMNDITLNLIGRSHCVDDIYRAFETAAESGIPHINTDIIAGLPGEDYGMFMHTLEEVIRLAPDNITVHTLAVKRASRLREQDADYHYSGGDEVGRMVGDAAVRLGECGYYPYYMYRQKHMKGNFENVSYAKEGTESVYNIRIMDEHQTIIALGAGGISKAYYDDGNRLERVPNVSNFEVYIQRIDEMIQRKEEKLYLPFE
jgi:oxygen-independent coproporphyrinogen-3 oxidase